MGKTSRKSNFLSARQEKAELLLLLGDDSFRIYPNSSRARNLLDSFQIRDKKSLQCRCTERNGGISQATFVSSQGILVTNCESYS